MSTRNIGFFRAEFRLFLLALLMAAGWMGLNFAFPSFAPTGIPTGVIRILINGMILIGLWRGLSRTDFRLNARLAVWFTIALSLSLWTALVWALALRGVFRVSPGTDQAPPWLPVAIFAPVLLGIGILTRSQRMAALLDAIPPSWLIGLQVYRILGGLFLVSWARGAIPGAFALPAGIGDVAVGLLALPVALRVSARTPSALETGIRWNLLGLTDFTIAVAMGVMTSPGPGQVFAFSHPNVQLGTFPTVMIPALTVPTSIILHALSLWQLKRLARRSAATPTIDNLEGAVDRAEMSLGSR